jgi:hypothetical protein
MIKLLRWLGAVPQFLVAYAALRSDAESAIQDPEVRGALDRLKADPTIAPLIPRLSTEWRAVEDAMKLLR